MARPDRQITLPGVDERFLAERIEESLKVIADVAARSEKPLIIQFSGGRDSMVLLGLVREAGVRDFVCCYMATGLEFHDTIQFVKDTCEKYGVKLAISTPAMHKGNIFKRVEQFQSWPGLIATWCCRDLKLRPQKKMLIKEFGKGVFYKLEGIRRFESTRRKYIYKEYTGNPIREDGEFKGSYEVFPIISWSDSDVLHYLEMRGLPTSGLYNEFGVSGCSWCPFYQPEIYYRVMQKMPDHYDRFIEFEEKIGQPSVVGHIYLKNIKQAVLEGKPCPQAVDKPRKSPCMMEWEGQMVQTCSIYGHLFLNGRCFRCDAEETE